MRSRRRAGAGNAPRCSYDGGRAESRAGELADAIRRGAQCTADFAAIDHLSHVDGPLEDVRRKLSIPARRS